MKQAGIIEERWVQVNPEAGLRRLLLHRDQPQERQDYPSALAKLQALDEVVEAYCTTGHWHLHEGDDPLHRAELQTVLIHKIQTIDGSSPPRRVISLQNPILRDVKP